MNYDTHERRFRMLAAIFWVFLVSLKENYSSSPLSKIENTFRSLQLLGPAKINHYMAV
jgi:hypothetical protein